MEIYCMLTYVLFIGYVCVFVCMFKWVDIGPGDIDHVYYILLPMSCFVSLL